jgi:hypothetical protein
MTALAEARYIVQDHKPFCSRHTLLLISGGEITLRGEVALEEFLRLRRRAQEVTT